MPPKPTALSFSVILSLPFILPDCSTLTACNMADAPRGIAIDPPIITGSSTTPLKLMPACELSTSIAWVSRTLIGVPAGTVMTLDAAGAAAAAGLGVGFGAGGGGGGVGLRAENSTDTASTIGTSDTSPLSSRTRTDLLSAPMNMPSTTLPDRSLTRSADSDALVTNTSSRAVTRTRRVSFTVLSSLDDGKRG